MGLCVGWYGDEYFLGIYLILISALEHIMYMMTSSPDVRNVSTVISSFYDNMEKCCKETSVTVHLLL